MSDKLSLEDEYIVLVSKTSIIISYYNKERGKIIEYFCTPSMSSCNTEIMSLGRAVNSSIRGSNTNAILTQVKGKIYRDTEMAKFLLNHAVALDEMKSKLKAYMFEKTGDRM